MEVLTEGTGVTSSSTSLWWLPFPFIAVTADTDVIDELILVLILLNSSKPFLSGRSSFSDIPSVASMSESPSLMATNWHGGKRKREDYALNLTNNPLLLFPTAPFIDYSRLSSKRKSWENMSFTDLLLCFYIQRWDFYNNESSPVFNEPWFSKKPAFYRWSFHQR